MAGITNYLENEALDHLFNVGAYTLPGTLYLALFTVAPDYETGTGGTEVSTSGTGYARATIAMTTANWNNAADASPNGKKVTNKGTAAFNYGTATGDWGTVVGALLVDTASGAWTNAYWGNALVASKTVNTDDTFDFPVDSIELSLDKATEQGITDFWKAEILDHITKTDASYTAPTTGYIALFTVAPDYIAGTGGTEVSGGSYERKSVTMASAWNVAAGGANSNNGAQAFVQATADWGTVVGALLVDTSAGAWTNAYAGKGLTVSKVVDSGDTFSIPDADWDNTLD